MSDFGTVFPCSTKKSASAAPCDRELSILREAGATKVRQLAGNRLARIADLARLLTKWCRGSESQVPHRTSGIGNLDHNPGRRWPQFASGTQRCDLGIGDFAHPSGRLCPLNAQCRLFMCNMNVRAWHASSRRSLPMRLRSTGGRRSRCAVSHRPGSGTGRRPSERMRRLRAPPPGRRRRLRHRRTNAERQTTKSVRW